MSRTENDVCEIKVRGDWVALSLDDALGRDASTLKRCVECRGRVRAHKQANNGMRAHFEHITAHAGCSLGACFNGDRTPHPQSLT